MVEQNVNMVGMKKKSEVEFWDTMKEKGIERFTWEQLDESEKEFLGHGNQGNVYKAKLRDCQTTVAVKKVLKKEKAYENFTEQQKKEDERKEQYIDSMSLRSEALVLASLNHKNIIKLIGVMEDYVKLSGVVEGNVELKGDVKANVELKGHVEGNVQVEGVVGEGRVKSKRVVDEDVQLKQIVQGNIELHGFVKGNFNLNAVAKENVELDVVVKGNVELKRVTKRVEEAFEENVDLETVVQGDSELKAVWKDDKLIRVLEGTVKLDGVVEEIIETCLILQYFEGGTLRTKLQSKLPYDTGLSYMQQLTETVLYLEKNQILHTDINPTNLMLDKDGNLKLIDFGFGTISNPRLLLEIQKHSEKTNNEYSMFEADELKGYLDTLKDILKSVNERLSVKEKNALSMIHKLIDEARIENKKLKPTLDSINKLLKEL